MSLSVSNLLMLVGMPYEVFTAFQLYPFPFPDAICIIQHFICECGSYASALTVTVFSIDRFLAVRSPLRMFLVVKGPRVIRISTAIWLTALVTAAAFAAQFGVLTVAIPTANCTIRRSTHCSFTFSRELKHSLELSSLLFFLLPGLLIAVIHVLIVIRLRSTRTPSTKYESGGFLTANFSTPRASPSRSPSLNFEPARTVTKSSSAYFRTNASTVLAPPPSVPLSLSHYKSSIAKSPSGTLNDQTSNGAHNDNDHKIILLLPQTISGRCAMAIPKLSLSAADQTSPSCSRNLCFTVSSPAFAGHRISADRPMAYPEKGLNTRPTSVSLSSPVSSKPFVVNAARSPLAKRPIRMQTTSATTEKIGNHEEIEKLAANGTRSRRNSGGSQSLQAVTLAQGNDKNSKRNRTQGIVNRRVRAANRVLGMYEY